MTSGPLRSRILFFGVSSLFESFQNRERQRIVIPKIPMAPPTTKLRVVKLPKASLAAAKDAKVVLEGEAALVDIGNHKKVANSGAYGLVYTSEPSNGECCHCLRQVKPEFKVGIPIRFRDDRFHHVIIVDIEDRACHLRCALAFLKSHARENMCYEGRITVLLQINEICNPGQPLLPAPGRRLHISRGGGLDDEAFDHGTKRIIPNPALKYQLCSLTYGTA